MLTQRAQCTLIRENNVRTPLVFSLEIHPLIGCLQYRNIIQHDASTTYISDVFRELTGRGW